MTATKATRFFRAVKGITDGYAHHIDGMVFESSPAMDAHFERTGGVSSDGSVLYVEATDGEFKSYADRVAADEKAREDAARGSDDAKRLVMSSPVPDGGLAAPGNK